MEKILTALLINSFFLSKLCASIEILGPHSVCAQLNNNISNSYSYNLSGASAGPSPNRDPYFDNFMWTGTNVWNISNPYSLFCGVTFKNTSNTSTLSVDYDYHVYDYATGTYSTTRKKTSLTVSVTTIGSISEITGASVVPLCSTSGIVYSINPVANATYYTWTIPAGWSANTLSGTNLTSINVTPSAIGGGQVTVRACNYPCDLCQFKAINITRPNITPVFTTTQKRYCAPLASAQLCVSAIPNASAYAWTYPSGWSGPSTTSTPCTIVNFNGIIQSGNVCCQAIVCGGFVGPSTCMMLYYEKLLTDAGIYWEPPTVTSTTNPGKKSVTVYLGNYYWSVYKYTKGSNGFDVLVYTNSNEAQEFPSGAPVSVIMINSDKLIVNAYNKNSCGGSEGIGRGYQMINGYLQPYDIGRTLSAENINGADESVKIFPNPATTFLTIKTSQASIADYNLRMYNLLGKKVKETVSINGNQTDINVADLENGIYFLQVDDGVTIMRKEKVIVNH